MLAAYHGHLEMVRVLLRHRSDPDLRNSNGQTPLAGAALKGDLPMIKLLLAYGADIKDASPDGCTALMIAAMFDRTRIVEYLVSLGSILDASDASGVSAADVADVAQRMGASKALALLQKRLAVTIISAESYMSDVRMPLFAEYWEEIYVRLTFYPHVARRLAFDFGCGSLWSRQYLSRAIRSDGSGHWRRCESAVHRKQLVAGFTQA